ncbi:DPCD protein family-domain-containing protein [Zopfochytrium polystomum]|nr:DPCD protein family-domain-containing protein [Zopfochytrium polystomum]
MLSSSSSATSSSSTSSSSSAQPPSGGRPGTSGSRTADHNYSGSDPPASTPGTPSRTSIIQDNRRKVRTATASEEIVEEFDLKTDVLLVRRVRTTNLFGRQTDWVYEVGAPPSSSAAAAAARANPGGDAIAESAGTPTLLRMDTLSEFQFRIRNLPYPKHNYTVTVDDARRRIVVRTANKKYFARIPVTDLDRLGIPLDPALLSFEHAVSTLVIRYRKPVAVLEKERAEREEWKKTPSDASAPPPRDGDVECKQQ